MAIAFDAKGGNFTNTGTITTLTWSHTVSGSDRIIFSTGRASNTGNDMTATYNGVSMTKTATVAGTNDRIFLFTLHAPATGANNLVLTKPSFAAGQMDGSSASYTGAKQTSTVDSSGTATATSASCSVSTTVVASNCWLVGGVRTNAGGVSSDGSGTTTRSGAFIGDTSSQTCISDSNGNVSTGSQSLNWTLPESNNWYAVVASFETAPASNLANLKTLDGIAKANIKTINGVAIASIKTYDGIA